MDLTWAAGGAVVGALAAPVLRGVVYRMSVPYGSPDRTGCEHCGHPAGGLRLMRSHRCPHCGGRLARPLVLELVTAAVLGLLAWRFAGEFELAAYAFLGVVGVALAAIDVAVHRLPDRLTGPAYVVTVVLFAVAAVAERDPGALLRALLAGVALAGGYLALAIVSPSQLGFGDVKLAGLLGIALGWLGWRAVLTGALLGFTFVALASLALLAARKVTMRSAVSFGPFMLAGALVAAVL
jgi:leader peptidase (prepilin peptidase) / N-methyltransferase